MTKMGMSTRHALTKEEEEAKVHANKRIVRLQQASLIIRIISECRNGQSMSY